MNIQIVEDDRSLSDGIEISLSDGEATFYKNGPRGLSPRSIFL